MRTRRVDIIFAGLMVVAALLLAELGLHIATRVSPKAAAVLSRNAAHPALEDTSLGWRPSPEFPGHDRKGFRNASIPQRAFIVALGDSQTYGTGVSQEEAWPGQLEKLAHVKTYNMAFGGYGPTHSLLLLDEALQLRPKLIIEAFYAGNDLFDSYNHVYRLKQLPYLRTPDEGISNAISERETLVPLFPGRYTTLYARRESEARHTSRWEYLATYSKTYRLLLGLKALFEVRPPPPPPPRKDAFAFIDGELNTIFTPAYRLTAIDFSDPRIVEGHRISLEAIRLMRDRTEKHDAKFLVVLLPTKEMAFRDLVQRTKKDVPLEYKRLLENEEVMWRQSKDFFAGRGIQFSDAVPILREHMEKGTRPYHESEDGHLTRLGHRIIAQLVLSQIDQNSLTAAPYIDR
jgi:hypothetical protein